MARPVFVLVARTLATVACAALLVRCVWCSAGGLSLLYVALMTAALFRRRRGSMQAIWVVSPFIFVSAAANFAGWAHTGGRRLALGRAPVLCEEMMVWGAAVSCAACTVALLLTAMPDVRGWYDDVRLRAPRHGGRGSSDDPG